MKDTNQVETISISDGNKVYEFEKPDFECELLKVFQGTKDLSIIGYFVGSNGESYQCEWASSGRIWKTSVRGEDRVPFNLTPVEQKKQWYEDDSNFPALISNGFGTLLLVNYHKENRVFDLRDNGYAIINSNWGLATKAERDSLFYLDSNATSSKETK